MAGTSLSRPAFYRYFTDLHELIESLLSDVETVLHETANPWVGGEAEPISALRESLGGVVQTCIDHGPIIRAVSEAAPLDERLEQAWSAFMRRWDDAVEARIKAQQEAGLVAPFDAGRVATALNRMDAAILINELGQRPQGDPEAVLDTLHHIWVGALYDWRGGRRNRAERRPFSKASASACPDRSDP
jgi:AcrR family transcriptional regulator